MVRMWAFQGGIATNVLTKQTDWTGLDRVVDAAQRNKIKLILVLGDQAGTCDDGHWRNREWYESGYMQAYNDYGNGLTPLPYLDYIKLVVSRYKNSTAIAMWEPVNEPVVSECTSGKGSACFSYQTCPNEKAAAAALRSFFDAVGGQIKAIDPNHLVSSGVIGDGQCGTVDVASYHDYGRNNEPMPWALIEGVSISCNYSIGDNDHYTEVSL